LYICASVASYRSIVVALDNDDPDRLYADRANLASARRAAEIWSARLKSNPQDFEAAWKLARADYWLGGHAPEAERRAFLEQGVEAGQKAAALKPDRPEGHFWTAANMGSLAESYGLRAGLKYRKPVKEELETVLRLDPAFQQGSADRALGRWYFRVPGLFGGGHKLAEEHLRASLKYNDNSTASHFFLAELLLDDGRTAEARAELQKVIDAPLDPDWTPEDQDFKAKARSLLTGAGAHSLLAWGPTPTPSGSRLPPARASPMSRLGSAHPRLCMAAGAASSYE
jgi:tetratricopeptide (TPR) repeat protein